MNVLIRVPNWIGDAVLALAAIEAYRREHPHHRLWILARPWVADIFRGLDWLAGLIPYHENEKARFLTPRLSIAGLLQLSRELRGYSFDRSLLFQNAFEAALLSTMAGIPQRIGYGVQLRRPLLTHPARIRTKQTAAGERRRRRLRVRFERMAGPAVERTRGRRDHEVNYYLDMLFQTGVIATDYLRSDARPPSPVIEPTPEGLAKALQLLDEKGLSGSPFLLLHPGSAYGPAKRWSSAGFAAVADHLHRNRGWAVAILGWGSDRALAARVAEAMQAPACVLSGPADLERTIGLISHSQALLTNDSGPMHLAAALNKPQVALFGSTDPATTGPLSPEARVIWKEAHCSPCHLRRCPLDRRCWDAITPHEVIHAIEGSI